MNFRLQVVFASTYTTLWWQNFRYSMSHDAQKSYGNCLALYFEKKFLSFFLPTLFFRLWIDPHAPATPQKCSLQTKTILFLPKRTFQSNNGQFYEIPCWTIDSVLIGLFRLWFCYRGNHRALIAGLCVSKHCTISNSTFLNIFDFFSWLALQKNNENKRCSI